MNLESELTLLVSQLSPELGDRLRPLLSWAEKGEPIPREGDWEGLISTLIEGRHFKILRLLLPLFGSAWEGWNENPLPIFRKTIINAEIAHLTEKASVLIQKATEISHEIVDGHFEKREAYYNPATMETAKREVKSLFQETLHCFITITEIDEFNFDAFNRAIKIATDLGEKERSESLRIAKHLAEKKFRDLAGPDSAKTVATGGGNESGVPQQLKEAKKMLEAGNFGAALPLFSEILSVEKNHSEAMLGKLRCLLGQNQFDLARKTFDIYLKKNNSPLLKKFNLELEKGEGSFLKTSSLEELEGLALRGGNDPMKVAAIHQKLTRALEIYPVDVEILDGLVFCFELQKNKINADLLRERLKKLAPGYQSRFQGIKKAACFVATSLFGPFSPEVRILRLFRDHRLTNFVIGKLFIKFYYRLSPRLVDFLAHSPKCKWLLKGLLRGIIVPVVKIIPLQVDRGEKD